MRPGSGLMVAEECEEEEEAAEEEKVVVVDSIDCSHETGGCVIY